MHTVRLSVVVRAFMDLALSRLACRSSLAVQVDIEYLDAGDAATASSAALVTTGLANSSYDVTVGSFTRLGLVATLRVGTIRFT